MEKAWKVTLYDTKARHHTTLLLRPVSRDVQLAHWLGWAWLGLANLSKHPDFGSNVTLNYQMIQRNVKMKDAKSRFTKTDNTILFEVESISNFNHLKN